MNASGLARKLVRVIRNEGPAGIGTRLVRKIDSRWGTGEQLYLEWDDVADPECLTPWKAMDSSNGRTGSLSIGWLISVPGPGSGGHTTIFRMVHALERAGHHCTLFVYDAAGGNVSDHSRLVRTWWPWVNADVKLVSETMPDMDAYVATAWQTAHVLAKRPNMAGVRIYFAQDYEPYFYPRGIAHDLAVDSYHFGFHIITMGAMIASELQSRFGRDSVALEFGCDTDVYSVTNSGPRSCVVFYAKPGVPRRAYELGIAALELFHTRRPDITIHTFGISARGLRFPAIVHSHLTPKALNDLYNKCGAGLSLSFTNVSLIPYELLAAGVVPVANDWSGCRMVLDNEHVIWTRPSPAALAAGLDHALEAQSRIGAHRLQASVSGTTWSVAQKQLVAEVERLLLGKSTNLV